MGLERRQQSGFAEDGIGLLLHGALDRRTVGQKVHHPGQGIGGRLGPRHNQGEDIAQDLVLRQGRARLIARGQQGLHERSGGRGSRGSRRHARPTLGQCRGERRPQRGDSPLHGAIRRAREDLPGGPGGQNPAIDQREDLPHVLREGCELVGQVVPEGHTGDDLDGVAQQGRGHVDHLARAGRAIPPGLEAGRHRGQHRKELAYLRQGQGRHHGPTLAAPGRAFGRKQAVAPDILQDPGNGAQAPKGLRALAEDGLDEVRRRQHDHGLPAQPERIEGPIDVGPVLQDRMELRPLELEQIADQRQPTRSRQGRECTAGGARAGSDLVWLRHVCPLPGYAANDGTQCSVGGVGKATRGPSTRCINVLLEPLCSAETSSDAREEAAMPGHGWRCGVVPC